MSCNYNDTDDMNEDIGIAMAGGSIRAASSCYGVLRGFQQKKIINSNGEEVAAIDMVKYNSCISGSSLPAVLYSYAQVPTDELLETCRSIDPALITSETLSYMPKTSMGYVLAWKEKGWLIVTKSILKILLTPWNIMKVHSMWTAVIYKKFFQPLKVPKNKYFTSSKKELEQILEKNSKLKAEDFLLPREGTKVLPMVLFTMSGPNGDDHEYMMNCEKIQKEAWEAYNAQARLALGRHGNRGKALSMTDHVLIAREKRDDEFLHGGNLPMPYVVTPSTVENKHCGWVKLRGRVVDCPEKRTKPFAWTVKKKCRKPKRLSIEFLVGMSTNIPGYMWKEIPFLSKLLSTRHTVTLSDGTPVRQKFVDGGINDLLGIIPLVADGIKNIIAVFNFNKAPSCNLTQTYAEIFKVAKATSMNEPGFDIQFEEWLRRISPKFTALFGFFGFELDKLPTIMNHIFHDPCHYRLKELMVKMNSLFKAGEPLIVTLKDLKVIANPFWNIRGGKTVNLTLMYFNLPEKFADRIPIETVPPPEGRPKIDKDGHFTNEEFKFIPEMDTSGVDQFRCTQRHINLMAYLGSWMIHHSWNGLKSSEGKLIFDGFEEIFRRKKKPCFFLPLTAND